MIISHLLGLLFEDNLLCVDHSFSPLDLNFLNFCLECGFSFLSFLDLLNLLVQRFIELEDMRFRIVHILLVIRLKFEDFFA